jgi:hypothetical protein
MKAMRLALISRDFFGANGLLVLLMLSLLRLGCANIHIHLLVRLSLFFCRLTLPTES